MTAVQRAAVYVHCAARSLIIVIVYPFTLLVYLFIAFAHLFGDSLAVVKWDEELGMFEMDFEVAKSCKPQQSRLSIDRMAAAGVSPIAAPGVSNLDRSSEVNTSACVDSSVNTKASPVASTHAAPRNQKSVDHMRGHSSAYSPPTSSPELTGLTATTGLAGVTATTGLSPILFTADDIINILAEMEFYMPSSSQNMLTTYLMQAAKQRDSQEAQNGLVQVPADSSSGIGFGTGSGFGSSLPLPPLAAFPSSRRPLKMYERSSFMEGVKGSASRPIRESSDGLLLQRYVSSALQHGVSTVPDMQGRGRGFALRSGGDSPINSGDEFEEDEEERLGDLYEGEEEKQEQVGDGACTESVGVEQVRVSPMHHNRARLRGYGDGDLRNGDVENEAEAALVQPSTSAEQGSLLSDMQKSMARQENEIQQLRSSLSNQQQMLEEMMLLLRSEK